MGVVTQIIFISALGRACDIIQAFIYYCSITPHVDIQNYKIGIVATYIKWY